MFSSYVLVLCVVSVVSGAKQATCPYKATGQFPYAPDCRRFINCFKGRGVIQICPAGTLFNPRTQECDFPSKVTCLDPSSAYRAEPHTVEQQQPHRDPNEDQLRQRNIQSNPNQNWKDGFKSYKIIPNQQPQFQNAPFNGHAGVQYPYAVPNPAYMGQPVPGPVLYPPPLPVPGPMLQPSPVRFNIPPMLFGNIINTSMSEPTNTPNPGYYVFYQKPHYSPDQPMIFSQNQPGYPQPAVYPGNSPAVNEQHSQGNLQTPQVSSNPQLVPGSQPGYIQHDTTNPQGHQSYQPQSSDQYFPRGQSQYPGSQIYPVNPPASGNPSGVQYVYPSSPSGGNQPLQPPTYRSQNPETRTGEQFYPQYNPPQKTQGQSGYPVPPQNPLFYPSSPQSESGVPQQNYPQSPNSRGFPPFPPGGSFKGVQNQPGYPQSREPLIFPEGGQPGYFQVNQNPTVDNPVVKQSPPKYYPSDPSTKSVKCPPGASGLFPHPNDCFKFLSCDHGRTFLMSCGPGTAFNPSISVCDYPQNVDCDKVANPQPNSDEGQPDENERQPHYTDYAQNGTGTEGSDGGFGDQDGSPSEVVDFDIRMNFNDNYELISTTARTTTTKAPVTTTYYPIQKPMHIPSREERNKKDPSENVQHNSTIKPKEIKPAYQIPQKQEIPPISKQLIRLRGGQEANEGYVEMRGFKEWGLVCDKSGEWTITEANIICKQIGYERGAELTWQGRPSAGNVKTKPSIAFSSVWCNGNETNILDCKTRNDKPCEPEREGVWVRCRKNPQSQCMPGEAVFHGRCYHLVVPREDVVAVEGIGFSQGEALAHCQVRRGHLLDITSQEENDFVSEWLVSQNVTGNIMTSGVGVSLMGAPLWIWEGSPDTFKYNNWWPGWDGNQSSFPIAKPNRALCVIARRLFPCPNSTPKDTAETSFCDAEYFFWDVEDCGLMSNKHTYICERVADDVGCVRGNGEGYRGRANVTETSTACLSWELPKVRAALKYQVSETTYRRLLEGHNYCRALQASDPQPWCYVAEADSIKKESCDIPTCKDHTSKIAEERAVGAKSSCGPYEFDCGLNHCIPAAWVCDGQTDCKNGRDESNCTGGLVQFKKHSASKLTDHDKEKWLHTSAANCATRCLQASDFVCRSFSHHGRDQVCLLSDGNVGLTGKLVSNQPEWEYHERTSHSINCTNMFQCGNGKCVPKNYTCNGKNDCGDRSDERNCSAANLGYEIRLGGSNKSNEGRVEVKILGQWGFVCDDQFDLRDAEVVCRELGFTLGAAEILPFSALQPPSAKPLYLVDDLKCRGNETSLRECDFGGWGVHDCGSEEVVGVVCKVPGKTCAKNFWQCEGKGECIPAHFMCDKVPDCDDGSDEDPERCKLPVLVRLVGPPQPGGSLNTVAGRLEVRKFGVWGTVCDDDFEDREASVVCKSLGYNGPAKSLKEAKFGEGDGVIWLQGVHCSGNESSLTECLLKGWGLTDCAHNEDVGVTCTHLPIDPTARNNKKLEQTNQKNLDVINVLTADDILPKNCGLVDEELQYLGKDDDKSSETKRVVKGQYVKKGTIPWQASILVRNSAGSPVHWCGAVIVSTLHVLTSAHCLQDYAKSAYLVRVGDLHTKESEGTEKEYDIESTYIHEDFNKGPRLSNDIALIKLKGSGMHFNSYVRAVCLPPPQTIYIAGTNCSISGWGSTATKPGSGFSHRLRWAMVPIISDAECRAPYVYGTAVTEGMFCAGHLQGGADACQGDSGGPFTCPINGRSVLYGITSWGHSCGEANRPGVYTRVVNYLKWIHSKIHDSMNGR